MTKGGTATNELEALVLRLREQGAIQISVTKGDTSITATFAPVMRPSQLPFDDGEGKGEEDAKTPVNSHENDNDLAYWSAN
jgi:hypothetical protein